MARIATKARKKVTTKVKTRVYDTVNYLRDEPMWLLICKL